MESVKNNFTSIKSVFILVLITITSVFISILSCQRYSQLKQQSIDMSHNVTVLSDSIKVYKGKNGELVMQAGILKGDIELLQITNSELYDRVKSMKIKNAELISKINGLVENPPKDTIWATPDSVFIPIPFKKEFEFKDKYRWLTGSVTAENSNVALNIYKDIFIFDYTLALKDDEIYITSTNPYVKYKSATGIKYTPSKVQRPKRWNIGIQLGIGLNYDLLQENFGVGPYLGVGISYGFSF